MRFLLFLSVLCSICVVKGSIPWAPGMKSFSSAIKDGVAIPDEEILVFSYNKGPGVITEQWFTGLTFNEHTIVNYYIDGDKNKKISYKLFLGHGIGFSRNDENSNVPWATKRISHNAQNGALFNTHRIPFSKNINITIQFNIPGAYYFIVRGVENYPVIIGDLQLPSNAYLKLFANDNLLVEPFGFIELANTTNMGKTNGLLYFVTVEAKSTDYNYLEGCFRVLIDNNPTYQFLSSGGEDFFLSAYYFDTGIYHDNDAGCTYYDGNGSMSAFKFFESDPVLFEESFVLLWRNCEMLYEGDHCPSEFPNNITYTKQTTDNMKSKHKVKIAPATISTYAWVYVWD